MRCTPGTIVMMMKPEVAKKILLEILKVNRNDNERVHAAYDDYMRSVAYAHRPELVDEANELVKGIDMWCA